MKLLEEKTFSVLQFQFDFDYCAKITGGKRIISFFPHTFYEFSLLWNFIKKLKSRFPWFYNSPRYFDFNHYIETASRSVLKPFRLKFRREHEFYNTSFSFWEIISLYYPESLEKYLSVELSNFLIENNFRLYDYINNIFINTSSIDILKALNYAKEKEETNEVFQLT